MQGALNYFTDIDAPRSPRNQKHPLIMLIGTTLIASLAGIDSFREHNEKSAGNASGNANVHVLVSFFMRRPCI